MQNKVFIIIVIHNGMQWLPRCLESTKPYSVIVVDNNSTDGSKEFVKNNYPSYILLEQKFNLGFGKANNIGMSHALKEGADYVFLLNQDAYLHQGTLDRLIKVHEKNKNFGIMSPIHLDGKGRRLDQNFSHYLSYKFNIDFYSDYVLQKEKKEIYEVPFVNAAGWSISRECLNIVGGFDPIFFHYGEDDNYCQRVTYHRLKVGVIPDTYLNHDREKREKPIVGNTFETMASSLRTDFSNINKDHFKQLENKLRSRKKMLVKAFFKLNLKAAKRYINEIKILEKLIPQISRSRKLNKKRGANYLEF